MIAIYTWSFENRVSQKKLTHSTTLQCKTIKNHSKADEKSLLTPGSKLGSLEAVNESNF